MDPEILNTVVRFVSNYLNDNDQRSPTIREIAKGCYISVGQTHLCLEILEVRGVISRVQRSARSVRIVAPEQR